MSGTGHLTRENRLYQRDYLMRQIELAAQALARILVAAKGCKRDQALALFDEAYKPLVGVSGRVVATLDEEQLLTLLTSGSAPDPRRVTVAVELLVTEADLRAEAGEEKQAAANYRRALGLTAYLAGHLGRLPEALGQYGDAEDVLFEVLDDAPDDTAIDHGIAFYQRLLAKEDDELNAGNLPRDEVRGALAELLRRQVEPVD